MVTCAGDGSLLTHLINAKKYGVDLGSLIIAALPYGTSNDFSRETGWGGQPDDFYYKSLKALMIQVCLRSSPQTFDVWDIIIKFKDHGDI